MGEFLIVTRHRGLEAYIRHHPAFPEALRLAPCDGHAGQEDVRGKHVVGVLPLHVAVHAASYTTIPLRVPRDMKESLGELTEEQIAAIAGPPEAYQIRRMFWLAGGALAGPEED